MYAYILKVWVIEYIEETLFLKKSVWSYTFFSDTSYVN